MRLSLRYQTTYTYGVAVGESHNALRACPMTGDHQRLQRYSIQTDPMADVVSYTDYWGTRVDLFGINERHTQLSVVADAQVETTAPPQPDDDSSENDSLFGYEYRVPSAHVAWDDALAQWAEEQVHGLDSVTARARAIHDAVGSRMAYVKDATEVGTPVADIFERREGVCQDYAHLALAAYRALGLAARYVSGYFYAAASGAAPEDDEVLVETHAWVEVHLPGFGWWGLDPTNHIPAGERHVKIGHGRDYEDVTPLRGTYHGDPDETELSVGVLMSVGDLATPVIRPQPPAQPQQQQQQ